MSFNVPSIERGLFHLGLLVTEVNHHVVKQSFSRSRERLEIQRTRGQHCLSQIVDQRYEPLMLLVNGRQVGYERFVPEKYRSQDPISFAMFLFVSPLLFGSNVLWGFLRKSRNA